ncbi:hypothetical protein E8E11_004499 [Didymella keratinophila]|nr:hypothetical protein E8E11_004499 [Didymella keratinophila]
MKNVLNAAQADDGVIGVVVVSREPAPTPSPPSPSTSCPNAFTCPENDGCTLQGTKDQVYALSCSTDYYGGDFSTLWAESLPACAQACVENSQCVAASFGGGNGAGTCYLKDRNNGAGASENADAIALVIPSPSATSSSPSSTAPSSSVAIPTSTSATSMPSSPSSTPTSTSTPISTPAPAPTQVIVNGNFEGPSYTPWTLSGFALATGTVTGQSAASPHNGDHSFQAQGESANNYWLMEMSQSVTVVPGQAYDVAIWSKQAG